MRTYISIASKVILILCAFLTSFDAAALEIPGRDGFNETSLYLSEEPVRHYNKGMRLEEQGLLDEAETEYCQVVRLAPAFTDARRRLADIYLLRGEPARAVEQYRAILGYHKENPIIHLRLGNAYEQSGNYREAITAYREAAKLAPGQLPARRRLASLLKKRGMTDEAVGVYKEILAVHPEQNDVRNELISVYIRKKKYRELTEFLRREADRDPDNPVNQYKLGIIHEFTRNYGEAEKAYRNAVGKKSDFAKALNALGRLYLKTGRFDEAKPVLEEARRADPNLKETRLLLQSIHDDLRPKSITTQKKSGKKSAKKRKRKSGKKHVKKSGKKKSSGKSVKKRKSSKKGSGKKSRSSKSGKKKSAKKKSSRKK